MIPKIIHYCWFGRKHIPREMQSYIKGWEKFHPSFKIIKWSENNCPSNFAYLNTAIDNGMWANASNFMRLYSLNIQGGIYFDTDVEVLKPFDDMLQYPCFLGYEKRNAIGDCINNAVVGAIPGHPFIQSCFESLNKNYDGLEMANLSSPVLTTKMIRSKSKLEYGKAYLDEWNIQLFPLETLYFLEYGEKLNRKQVDERTFSIHHYKASWHTANNFKWLKKMKEGAVRLRDIMLNQIK